MKVPKEFKKITNREYMFGDFDKDSVKNIDDPYPFDINKRYWDKPNPIKSSFGDNEVKLSNELLEIERHNNSFSPILKGFIKQEPRSFGRIKSVPSTMKKLRIRYIDQIKDIAGAKIVTRNRQEAYERAKQIEKKYRFDPKEKDDYYKNPKGNVHYALHYGLLFNGNKPKRMEVQIQSKPMAMVDRLMHIFYKKDNIPKRFIKKTRSLFKRGF